MKLIRSVNDLEDKKVLLRTDFDVPVLGGKITENFRIEKQKPMIDHLLNNMGSRVVMVAHISAVSSFKGLVQQLENILSQKINFIQDPNQLQSLPSGELFLLDNIRQWSGEKNNDNKFAEQLSRGFDLYINNNFAVSHRNHASVSAITKFLPSYAGFILEEETHQLQQAINTAKEGKIIIIGGAKMESKVPVIKNFIDKAEKIIIGGVVANDILKARGKNVGDSVVDNNTRELFKGLDLNNRRLIIPDDFNIFENKILDIGPNFIKKCEGLISNAKMVIWNGPMGLCEDKRFLVGTYSIAKAISKSDAFKIIGGGDTIAAVDKVSLLDKFDFVSTGGGAMLEFLAGNELPGLKALNYYDTKNI